MPVVTHRIGEREYTCYEWTFILACASRGPDILMAVASAADAALEESKLSDLSREDFLKRVEIMKSDLKQVMVKPRLVDEYTDSPDAVTWQEMGDDFGALHQRVTQGEAEAVKDFPESSEVQEE